MSASRRFRVWDGEQMLYPPHPYLIDANGQLHYAPDFKYGKSRRSIDIESVVMHTTGLIDGEGHEVYEGDIISHDYNGQPDLVEWSDWYPGFDLRHVHHDGAPNAIQTGTVIGNIYNNPKMLDETG